MAGEPRVLTTGSELNQLDIFLNFQGTPVAASGVTWDICDAGDNLAVSGSGVNPSIGKYTASGTVPTGFQLGTWEIKWDVTLLDGTIIESTEQFCVQAPTVTIGFTPPEDKTASIYKAVQIDIGDPDGAKFNENYLQPVLIKAVRRLNHKLGTAVTFRGPIGVPGQFGGRRVSVIEITVDTNAGTISPNNDEVCDLIIMQMEVIILAAELNAGKRFDASATSGPHVSTVTVGAMEDITARNADGVTISVGGRRSSSRANLMKFAYSEAKRELDMAVRAFLNRNSANFGKLIW